MRSVWSTLVAVALVVAGARVGTAQASSPGQRELHAAKTLRVAPTVRRAHNQARHLDSLVVVARVELPAVARHALPSERRATIAQPVALHLFVRSSRGPPRA